jgi:carbonic anhydrase/acetyltransferase-like protein (isoleucine patch superfamily)
MLITRNGQPPIVHPSAVIASSAQVIGNVSIGESCCVDYNAVIESSSTPIEIADHVMVLANVVIRSTGGARRPTFPVRIEDHTLISPLCSLVGCQIGRNCYLATGVMIFQGADWPRFTDQCRGYCSPQDAPATDKREPDHR